jgi:hypothetical protein
MNTNIYKGHGGWQARSEMDLGNGRVLSLTTKKWNSTLKTFASVSVRNGDFLSHTIYRDFSKFVAKSTALKVTEKAVRELHDQVTTGPLLESLLADIHKHYLENVDA